MARRFPKDRDRARRCGRLWPLALAGWLAASGAGAQPLPRPAGTGDEPVATARPQVRPEIGGVLVTEDGSNTSTVTGAATATDPPPVAGDDTAPEPETGIAPATDPEQVTPPLPRPDVPEVTPAAPRRLITALPMTARPTERPDLSLPPPRPRPLQRMDPSCTADGRLCIRLPSYAPDLCRVIEAAAAREELDAHFLARLLWQESRFSSRAVSPAGAQGIAQFIPSTADLRDLEDPFDPASAVEASAAYLKDLEQRFGNLGLAAAAYNGGENRLRRYLAGESGLPGETRAYVVTITGQPIEIWIAPDAPPPPARPTRLPRFAAPFGPSFHDACLALATQQAPPSQIIAPDAAPWLAIFAAHPRKDMARRRGNVVYHANESLFAGTRMAVAEHRLPGSTRPFHAAQVGLTTRQAAQSLCTRLRSQGVGCMVRAQ
ncbi:transglycosylase SLT domain-containing protein [Fluviibacterium sp. DFM31]|uniref:Transglycosylase SLT domain-containing protein n=1 Tax=Meridianimarinicoccus marinus TaxID=3231483 RepID=A0ABV3L2Y6_9RHOB